MVLLLILGLRRCTAEAVRTTRRLTQTCPDFIIKDAAALLQRKEVTRTDLIKYTKRQHVHQELWKSLNSVLMVDNYRIMSVIGLNFLVLVKEKFRNLGRVVLNLFCYFLVSHSENPLNIKGLFFLFYVCLFACFGLFFSCLQILIKTNCGQLRNSECLFSKGTHIHKHIPTSRHKGLLKIQNKKDKFFIKNSI